MEIPNKHSLKALLKWWQTWHTLPVLSWMRAASFYRRGCFAQAVACYEQGLSGRPGHPARFCARLDLSYCLFRLGKLTEAERQLKLVCSQVRDRQEAFVRLARLQLWTGRPLDAAWTLRRALRSLPANAENLSYLLYAVLEHQGQTYLMTEAMKRIQELDDESGDDELLQAVLARVDILRGDRQARVSLAALAASSRAMLEVRILEAQTLLEEGDVAALRHILQRAMQVDPECPRVLSLLALSYLQSGDEYNPQFALQHAVAACQKSCWLSARELHILAEAYFHCGDNVSALSVAVKAVHSGTRLLGNYSRLFELEQLIETIQNGVEPAKSGAA